jgi:hypothetical protein
MASADDNDGKVGDTPAPCSCGGRGAGEATGHQVPCVLVGDVRGKKAVQRGNTKAAANKADKVYRTMMVLLVILISLCI